MDKVKVAAIFDKPKHCEECPLNHYANSLHHKGYCALAKSPIERLKGPSYEHPIPDWCPLVEPILYKAGVDI